MPIAARDQFEALNGLRGIAALVVVEIHLNTWFGWTMRSGYLAVDFFFLLSGFVLAHAYDQRLASGLSWPRFMLIRLIRLYPLYFLSLVVMVGFSAWAGELNFGQMIAGLAWLPYPVKGVWGWFIIASWSVAFELVINLLMAVFHRYLTTLVLLVVGALGMAGLLYYGITIGRIDAGFRSPYLLAGFARVFFSFPLGMLLYRHRDRFAGIGANWSAWPAAFLIVGIFLLNENRVDRPFVDLAILAIGFPLLLTFAAGATPNSRTNATMKLLGALSYAIYVLHQPLGYLLHRAAEVFLHNKRGDNPVDGLVVIAIIIAISLGAHFVYDVPIRRALTRWFGARPMESRRTAPTTL